MTENDVITLLKNDQIEVPKEKVYRAIQRGVYAGQRSRMQWQKPVLLLATAITVLLAVGVSTGRVQAFLKYYNFYNEFGYQRSVTDNPAEAFVMVSGKRYSAERLDGTLRNGVTAVRPGYYDLKLTEGSVAEMPSITTLSPGQTYHNFHWGETNEFQLETAGAEIAFQPAAFTKLPLEDNQYVLENVLGSFEVGKEIEAGAYTVHVETDAAEFDIGVGQINNVFEGSETEGTKYETIIYSYTAGQSEDSDLILHEGSVFTIVDQSYRVTDEVKPKNIKVILTKLAVEKK